MDFRPESVCAGKSFFFILSSADLYVVCHSQLCDQICYKYKQQKASPSILTVF